MRRAILIAVAGLLELVGNPTAEAATIFSESFTGANLYSDSRVLFPSRTPSLSGSSLLFDTGTEYLEKLFVLSLVPANTLSLYDPVIVDISMNLTARRSDWPTYPTDFDPIAAVGDGNNMVGFQAADNFGGTIVGVRYQDAGNRGIQIESLDLVTNVGYPNIGESFDVHGKVTLLADSTEVFASFLGGSANHVFAQPIDRTQPFNFIFLAHDAEERYQLNSLSIQVSGTVVPEPATLAIWSLLGGIGLVVGHRRRRRKAA